MCCLEFWPNPTNFVFIIFVVNKKSYSHAPSGDVIHIFLKNISHTHLHKSSLQKLKQTELTFTPAMKKFIKLKLAKNHYHYFLLKIEHKIKLITNNQQKKVKNHIKS